MQARSMKIITLEFPGEPGVLGVHCGRWLASVLLLGR